MAEEVTVRMVVGSHRPYGENQDGSPPFTELGMMSVPDYTANTEVLGKPPARVTVFLQDPLVEGVQLNDVYDVTFTPVE